MTAAQGRRVLVAGGTGLIGTALVRALLARGDRVTVLTRNPAVTVGALGASGARVFGWNATGEGLWTNVVGECDAVVNLAGAPLAGRRWTAARKEELVRTRLDATHALVGAIARATPRPGAFLSASAVGFYGNVPEGDCPETAPPGDDFLAHLCRDWEAAAREAEASGVRTVLLRTGLVLDRNGGALQPLLLPVRLGVGGPIGTGRQWWPWIHIADEAGLILHAIDHPEVAGPLNLTAPNPVRMRDFIAALARALHRPAVVRTPAFAVRALLGEVADAVVLGGQRALPARALQTGYRFRFSYIDDAMHDLFPRGARVPAAHAPSDPHA